VENDKYASKESLASIGERLKNAREKKGLAIDQVQKQTHIYSTILTALEEGRCDEILTKTYVKSFLKKYSHYLGLDSSDILKQYIRIHPEEPTKSTVNIDLIEVKRNDIFSRFIHIISFALLLIAFLSLMTFLGKKLIPSSKKPKTVKTVSIAKNKPIPAVPQQISIPKKVPLDVVLKVKQPVMVGIKKDGMLLFKRVMPKGSIKSLTADEKVEIYVAKAEAIEIILNNKSLGSPGRGVIKNLEITRKGIRIR